MKGSPQGPPHGVESLPSAAGRGRLRGPGGLDQSPGARGRPGVRGAAPGARGRNDNRGVHASGGRAAPRGMVLPDAAGAGRRPAVAHQVPRPDSWIGGVRCRPRCDLMDGCPRVKDSRRRICSLPACKSFSECKSWHAHQGVAGRPSHFVGAAELVARGLLGRQRKAPHVTAATRVGAGGAAATVGVVATALARIGGGKLASSPTSQDFVNFEWLTREPSLSPLRAERSRPKRRRFVGVSGRTFPRRP